MEAKCLVNVSSTLRVRNGERPTSIPLNEFLVRTTEESVKFEATSVLKWEILVICEKTILLGRHYKMSEPVAIR